MTTLQYISWEYRWNRKLFGPFKSAWLAVKVATKFLPF